MEQLSAKNVKRIDFTTIHGCEPCKPALRIVRKVAGRFKVPVVIHNGLLAPKACVVKDKDGVEVSDCVTGYGSGYKKDIENRLKNENRTLSDKSS